MERKSFIKLGLALLTFGFVVHTQAADASGTWAWTTPGRDGAPGRKSTLKLKTEGDKVTGKLTAPGRQGGEPTETEISNGKIKGDEISFEVTREFNGNKFTSKYAGKLSGDTIKGTVERPGRGGGDPQKNDWEAKRETEKK
jgi:hypothetical protein